jgi:hypothetical protein
MVECIQAFAECCYIACRNAITSSDLVAFKKHLEQFYSHHNIFMETSVRTSISLPRQHALMHYPSKIEHSHPQMVSVLQLQNLRTSQQSKNHGNA